MKEKLQYIVVEFKDLSVAVAHRTWILKENEVKRFLYLLSISIIIRYQ